MTTNNPESFERAVSCISASLKGILLKLDNDIKNKTYEIRLRAGRPVILFGSYSSAFLSCDSSTSTFRKSNTYICSVQELNDTFNRICGYSIHTHQNSIVNGYVTVKGGHRVGIAGTAVCDKDGNVVNIRNISSLNIRIARQYHGCSQKIVTKLFSSQPHSLIIAGPPSSGKTTLLRDLSKKLSVGDGCKCFKLTLIDEREEIAAVNCSMPINDVGYNCDILSAYPKDKAIISAIKTLSPEIIVCDEIGTDEEVRAIRLGVNSGVRFIVTIHAADFDELISRPQIQQLLDTYSFDKVIMLHDSARPCEIKSIYDAGELRDEIYRCRAGIYGNTVFGNNDFDKA